MKFTNEKWGKEKVFYISPSVGVDIFTLKEFNKGVKMSELTMTTQEANSFMEKLENDGWEKTDTR